MSRFLDPVRGLIASPGYVGVIQTLMVLMVLMVDNLLFGLWGSTGEDLRENGPLWEDLVRGDDGDSRCSHVYTVLDGADRW